MAGPSILGCMSWCTVTVIFRCEAACHCSACVTTSVEPTDQWLPLPPHAVLVRCIVWFDFQMWGSVSLFSLCHHEWWAYKARDPWLPRPPLAGLRETRPLPLADYQPQRPTPLCLTDTVSGILVSLRSVCLCLKWSVSTICIHPSQCFPSVFVCVYVCVCVYTHVS